MFSAFRRHLMNGYCSVTYNLDGLTASGQEYALFGMSYNTTFTCLEGKQFLPSSVRVIMNNIEITDDVFNIETNEIVIPTVNGNIEIEAEATSELASGFIPLHSITNSIIKFNPTSTGIYDTNPTSNGMLYTDFIPSPNTKIEIDINPSYYTYRLVFCGRGTNVNGSSTDVLYLWNRYNNINRNRFAFGSHSSVTNNLMRVHARNLIVMDKGVLTYDTMNADGSFKSRETIFNYSSDNAWSTTRTFVFFGGHSVTSYYGGMQNMLHGAKFYDYDRIIVDGNVTYGNEYKLQRKYIPVKRISDDKFGIYDLINGTFVTCNFATGPSVRIKENNYTNCNVTYISNNLTTDVNAAVIGVPWIVKYTPTTDYTWVTFQVIVNGADKTNDYATYDSSDNSYTVTLTAHWKDEISITAFADYVIVFEDSAVKQICVSNWGGNNITGEITKSEAEAVTTLDGKFYNNQDIVKFHELQYFTGLSNLRYSSTASQFATSTLEEVTVPSTMTDLQAAFYNARKIKSLDLSNLTGSNINMTNIAYTTSIKGAFYTVTLPRAKVNLSGAFRYTDLTTLNADGSDWSGSSNFTNTFYNISTTLKDITGTITGISQSLSLSSSSALTRDSLLVLINGLKDLTGQTGMTLTLHATAKARLTADDIAIATAKNWTIN